MSRAPNSDLHALIASLSQAERRYVKQELRRHVIGTVNQSERLYDAIAEQSTYDEEAVKRGCSDLPCVRRLPEAKRELMRVILRAMRQFHARRTPQRSAISAYLDGLFLGSKGLSHLADRSMQEAVAHSLLTENHALRSLLKQGEISMQRWAGSNVEPTSPYTDDPVVLEALQALEVARMQALLERLQATVKRYGQTTNAAAHSIAADLMAHGRTLQPLETVAARQLWLRMQSVYRFFFHNDAEGSLAFDRQRLAVIEEREQFRQANTLTWLNLNHSVALRLAVLTRIDEALPYRDTLREYWSTHHIRPATGQRNNTLSQYLNLEVFIATQTLHKPLAEDRLSSLADLNRQIELTGHTEIGIAAWINLGLIAFAADRFRQAIRLLNEVDAYDSNLRPDVHRASHYLRIMCHMELEHDSVVTSMTRRARRLWKGAELSAAEDTFLSCAAAYLSTTPGTQRQRLLHSSRTSLDQLGDVSTTPIGMIAFPAWLQSKLERRPWRELAAGS